MAGGGGWATLAVVTTTARGPRTGEDEILARGLEAFAELGYEQTSVRVLARRIGVSHNFINDRYGSKIAFWRAVVDFGCGRLEPLFTEHDEGLSDEDALVTIIRRQYRNVAHQPAIHRLLWDEASRESERLDYFFEHYLAPNASAFAPVVERLIADGKIRPTPLELLVFAILGPTAALVQRPLAHRLGSSLPDDPQGLEELADLLARQVLAGTLPGSVTAIDGTWPAV